MALKYSIASDGSTNNKEFGGFDQSLLQLSDGTPIWLNGAASGARPLRYTSDRATVTTAIASAFTTGPNGASMCRDAADNLYMSGYWTTGGISVEVLKKGSGYSWTNIGSKTNTGAINSGFKILWCNTGGGTGGAGHIIVFATVGGPTGVGFVYDAGALLANPSTTPNPVQVTSFNSVGNPQDAAQNGFGGTTGVVAEQNGTTVIVGGWSINSAGVLTVTSLTSALNANSSVFPVRVVRYAANAYAVVYADGTTAGRYRVATYSSNAQLIAGTASGAPAGMPLVSNFTPGTAGATYTWEVQNDPTVPNVIRVLAQDTVGRVVSVTATLSPGITWGTTGVLETDTEPSTQVTPLGIRVVRNPEYTLNGMGYGDWQIGTNNAGGTNFLYDGSYHPYTPVAPTTVTPSNGATINTDIPVLGMDLLAGRKGEWQFATDSAFTLNIRDIVEADSDIRVSSGTNTETVPVVSKLFQGTWYLRGRSVGVGGSLPSGWSTTNVITDTHPPSTNTLTPTGGQYQAFGVSGNILFAWHFSSTSSPSTQTAYEIIVERNSDGLLVVDTGKVFSTTQNGTVSIPATYKDVDLRWRIRVWDNDDVVGSYSANQIFRVGDAPTVTVTAPVDGSTVTVNNPTATWTFAAGGGRIQTNYRVVFKRDTDNAILHDSGTISGTATSYVPPGFIVDNATSHTVTVTVTDSGGIQGSDSNSFISSWVVPTQPAYTVDASMFASLGYVKINWNNSSKDPDWSAWRIYRKLTTASAWTFVYETSTDQSNYEYHDYLVSANTSQDWAVVQVVTRFGSQVESNRNATTVTPADDHYWLVRVNNNDTANLRLAHVTGDSFADNYEEEEVHLLGRGRHIEYGDRLGYAGTVNAELRDTPTQTARAQKILLDQMKANRVSVWLRNPFGDVWEVSVSDLSYERLAGVGTSEFLTVSVPYSEVSD